MRKNQCWVDKKRPVNMEIGEIVEDDGKEAARCPSFKEKKRDEYDKD